MDGEEQVRLGKEKLNSREYLWRTLKPAGCIFVLLMAAASLVICFTAGRDPINGYCPPEDTEYYASHPQELKAELEKNVLPQLEGIKKCEAAESGVVITIEQNSFVVTRSALLRYFDESLLELVPEA